MLATASAPEVRQLPRPHARTLRRLLASLALGALLLVGGHEVGRRLFGWNFHTVLPGLLYRGAQPSRSFIERLAQDYGVRTIVNLRGCGLPEDWYSEEAEAAQTLGLNLEDVCFSATRLPSAQELRRLVEVFDRTAGPMYLHCRRGADRTGMAAAIYLLLKPGNTFVEARAQLGLYYGHVALGGTRVLDQFFDLYEEWLANEGRAHDSGVFRHWLLDEYHGGWCSAWFEEVTPMSQHARVGCPLGYRVRVRNTGTKEWRMRVGSLSGFHLGYQVWDGGRLLVEGRGGMMDKCVAPGDSVAVTLVVAPLPRAGTFRLLVDMVEEQHCWFFQAGSEPHEEELVVAQ